MIGWVASLARLERLHEGRRRSGKSFDQFGLHLPMFSADVWRGLAHVAPLLVTAIPLGIYNFTEAMNNVESASAAGDNYNLRKILLADGIGAVVGSMLGSPFPPAVYIGHPGWKAVGGRIGYSLATGVAIALVCFLGLTALLLAVIPLVAILPILLYIGLVIGAQAFQASPRQARAGGRAGASSPTSPRGRKTQVDSALDAAGTSAAAGRRWPSSPAPACSTTAWSRSAAARCSPGWCSARSRPSSSTPDAPARRVGLRRRGARLRRPHPRRAARLGHVAAGRAGLRAVRRRVLRRKLADRPTRTVSRAGTRTAGAALAIKKAPEGAFQKNGLSLY